MDIYHYDIFNGTNEYVSTGSARKSPLWKETDPAEDEYLIPAGATTIAPPASQDGYARCFVNGAWSQVEDHRGEAIYSTTDASQGTVTTLGPIPEGFTTLTPCAYPKWSGSTWEMDATKETAAFNAGIKAQLAALDLKRIRSLAEGDTEYLATLNAQAVALRAQLK